MVIITTARLEAMKTNKRQALLAIAVTACMFSISGKLAAKELSYVLGLETDVVQQDLKSVDQDTSFDATNVIITPQLTLSYKARKVSAFWRVSQDHVRRSLDDEDVSNNYTEYNYGGKMSVIDKLLDVTANGALSYQSLGASGFLVNDFLLNASQLTKTRNNRFGSNLTLPRGDYFGFTSSLSYASSDSDRNAGQANLGGLNNDTYSVNSRLTTGNNFRRLSAQAESQYQLTQRQERGDYTSRVFSANLSYSVYHHLGVTIVGSSESNQVEDDDSVFANTRKFSSLGAGLIWKESENRLISLTWNKADGDSIEQDDNNKGYVGIDLDWQFSPRTRVSGQYERRFYGNSGEFSLSHNTKFFRSRVSYKEEVTSYARLLANPENLGVFVCENGNTDLAACFQPPSLEYQLQANESFVQFSQQNFEINDELILRKSVDWQAGIERRRTKFLLSGRYSENEYLESPRDSRTYNAGALLSFKVGRKTDIKLNTDYAVTHEKLDGDVGEAEVLTTTLAFDRKFGRYIIVSLDFRYLDRVTTGRELSTGTVGGIRGDLTDRRISLNVNYRFSGK